MTAVPTLLVPLDGYSSAMAALPVARGLASLLDATVTLFYVGNEALAPDELLGRIKLAQDDARGLIIEQDTGSPADVIVRAASARDAAFIVMIGAGRPSDPSCLFEGVTGGVLRMAPCPVVLVPPDRGQKPWVLRRVALPHDGTPTSAAAIAPTANLASRAGAELLVIHVATPGVAAPAEPGTFAAPRYLDHPHHEWPMWTSEFLERVRCACHPARPEKIRLLVAQGESGEAILELARHNESDLIALAWRGGLEPKRAKTIRRVVRGAHCPVIIFRVQP
ncbi:universal stress protein [Methylosinus sp. KRF6]|uniref:universal stress protein n=1 Tax=Methylosinus sp. KRF6 TaxID=2846853 RepID=UPI001C0C1314|nr:universal stress protein [Methylosinus sp. KRF6]MBU3887865.1 universal stress protein [Methylosinus sp. KRF6]